MPTGTVTFTAFAQSGAGIASGLTIAQKAAAVPRPGVLGMAQTAGSTLLNFTADTNAGFTLAEIECGWGSAENGGQGNFSSGYLSGQASIAAELKAAGYQVAVSAGIFDPPTWINTLPNWQHIDQGGHGSGTPNFAFSPAVRSAAAAYITQLTSAMTAAGVDVDYYRMGISPSGETHLPDTLPITSGTGSWWAFDALAQAAGGTGLPPGVGANPLIGWTPGNSTYSGGSVNSTMAGNWWDWYMGAASNAHQWEIAAHQAGGWNGCIMLCTPGRGCSPAVLNSRIANLLGPSTLGGTSTDFTANIAAYWPTLLSTVADPANTVLDISSVFNADGGTVPSGFGGNTGDQTGVNNCTGPGDSALPLTATSGGCADPYHSQWSGVRWLAYLAGQNGLLTCGESVGDDGSHTWGLQSQVAGCMNQAQQCGLYALMWANDTTMNPGGGSHPYATAANVVTGFNAVY